MEFCNKLFEIKQGKIIEKNNMNNYLKLINKLSGRNNKLYNLKTESIS